MTKVSNKRQFYRSDCIVPVDGKSDAIFSQIQTTDFSKRGLGCISSKEVPTGTKITVELDLAEYEEPILVIGEVMWCRPDEETGQYRIGMKFVDILRGSKARLDQYFRKHSVKRWV